MQGSQTQIYTRAIYGWKKSSRAAQGGKNVSDGHIRRLNEPISTLNSSFNTNSGNFDDNAGRKYFAGRVFETPALMQNELTKVQKLEFGCI